jgi:predicted RNase H-like nuclease (RuvC/YqgF family)
LEAKNIKDQNKAMEAITTMMTKQAAKDKELKENLEVKTQEVKELEAKVAALEAKIADDDDDGDEGCDDDDGDEDDDDDDEEEDDD